jgi:hypothetical protein
MSTYWLKLLLVSDTTFGRGDGVAGVVDGEVQHDPYGLPYLHGKTLKGLLSAAADELLDALGRATPDRLAHWQAQKDSLFGRPGSRWADMGALHVGDATLPQDLRDYLAWEQDEMQRRTRAKTLEALTAVRRATAMDYETGAPRTETLRAMRVIVRDTPFTARLDFADGPTPDQRAFLAACVMALRRAGSGRNRGRGQVTLDLYESPPDAYTAQDGPPQPITAQWFAPLRQELSR